MMTDLVSVKASMLPHPPSRPSPDCLYPPNGAFGHTVYSLMPIVPARIALATRKARAHVAGVNAGAQSVLGVVGQLRGVRLVVEGHGDQHRAEDLFARHAHGVVHIGEQGGVDEVALGQVAARAGPHRPPAERPGTGHRSMKPMMRST